MAGQKDQEIQRLRVEIKTCEELAAIRSTLITNLNDLNEAQSVELTRLQRSVGKDGGGVDDDQGR